MHNDLFTIGSITIHSYGLMIAIGLYVALLVAEKRGKARNLNIDFIDNVTFLCVLFGFIGAKLLYIIVEFPTFIKDPLAMIFSGNGFVVYGGFIAAVLTGILYAKYKKVSFLEYLDLAVPSFAIGQGFGRIGCFLAGCCYGAETNSFIGIAFTNSEIAPNGVKLIPTQLISSLGLFILAFILIKYAQKKRTPGDVSALFLVLYSIGRFIIEFFRNDYRGTVGFLSTSQFISIFIFLLGIGLFIYNKKRNNSKEESKS